MLFVLPVRVRTVSRSSCETTMHLFGRWMKGLCVGWGYRHQRATTSSKTAMFGAKSDREPTAQEKVTAEWDVMAGEWDDMASGYAKGFYKLLWDATGLDPDNQQLGVVVDFGCGTGILSDRLRVVSNKVVALDASAQMISVLRDKIRSMEWQNVDAAVVVLAAITDESTKEIINGLQGTVDLIVASSVMSFIPDEDLEETMQTLGRMLKPGGLFCHSDWPKSESKHTDGMDEAKAEQMYAMGGLTSKMTKITAMDMGGESMEVFVGVAEKS